MAHLKEEKEEMNVCDESLEEKIEDMPALKKQDNTYDNDGSNSEDEFDEEEDDEDEDAPGQKSGAK
eukprot:3908844-Ditylum_brightwellii.AAC.1